MRADLDEEEEAAGGGLLGHASDARGWRAVLILVTVPPYRTVAVC